MTDIKSKKITHSFLLILTALIWGIAFVAQSEGGNAIGPYSFNCIRFFIGGIILMPVIYVLDKKGKSNRIPQSKADRKLLYTSGILCGIFLAFASIVQQLGLYYGTIAGKAGFLTACYILIVPVLGIFLHKKCGWNIWVGVALALVGLYLLCINKNVKIQISDLLVLSCSLLFSFQIMLIDHYAPLVDKVRLSSIQFITSGFVCAIPMFFIDMKHSISGICDTLKSFESPNAWITILYAGILSCGVAYTLQVVAQEGLNPTIASLLMSLESVFSVLAGWIILNQTLTLKELLGCTIMFGAIILAQLPVKSKRV